MSAADFFNAARAYKRELTGNSLDGLSQEDVNHLNAATAGRWKPAGGQDAVSGSQQPSGAVGALRPSQAALALIKSFEGCEKKRADGRLDAYPDPGTGGDPWTIGWGSTGPDVKRGTVWTQEQADNRFASHVDEFAAGVRRMLGTAATSQQEFDALVSFAYNVGLGALKTSTLLKKHLAGDKAGAAAQFGKWVNAGGRPMKGLIRRREAEARLYRGGA